MSRRLRLWILPFGARATRPSRSEAPDLQKCIGHGSFEWLCWDLADADNIIHLEFYSEQGETWASPTKLLHRRVSDFGVQDVQSAFHSLWFASGACELWLLIRQRQYLKSLSILARAECLDWFGQLQLKYGTSYNGLQQMMWVFGLSWLTLWPSHWLTFDTSTRRPEHPPVHGLPCVPVSLGLIIHGNHSHVFKGADSDYLRHERCLEGK